MTSSPSSMPGPTARSWARTTTGICSRPKCSSPPVNGRPSAAARRSTTCWRWNTDVADGLLIAFEGLDQSGKQTQAERLRDRLTSAGRTVQMLSFPDYATAIGTEIGMALRGEREYAPDVMQLLYVANRYEWKPAIV